MPDVSVVIPTMNEEKHIAAIVTAAKQIHPSTEVIVVDNGSSDSTAQRAKKSGANVIFYKEALGHDVGRAIGAKAATGNAVLFLDGDMYIPSDQLQPFVSAIHRGVDVALNQHLGKVEIEPIHSVVLSKHALQLFMRMAYLKGYSMTTIPHALSRKAIQTIGASNLMIPPLALQIAVQNNLRIEAVHPIPVGLMNPKKRKKVNGKDPLQSVIMGDHIEALAAWIQLFGDRGGYGDGVRQREKVNEH
jgi:glycosyltransferase involved in cell wall biosynthesis